MLTDDGKTTSKFRRLVLFCSCQQFVAKISDEIVGWTVDIQTSTRNMSRRSSVLSIHIVCLYLCCLDVFVIKTFGIGRQKRYTEENICLESKKTTVIVNHCPGNIDAFNKRSKKKNCDSYAKCAGESLVYHCVRSRGIFVEVCAPRNLIIGSFCAYYDNGLGRVIENYNYRCMACPFKYPSDEFVYNSECVKTAETDEDFNPQSSLDGNANLDKRAPTCNSVHIYITTTIGVLISSFCLVMTCRYLNRFLSRRIHIDKNYLERCAVF